MSENGAIHFLLVDDLEENLISLEALLRREGLGLLKARSGPEALELLLKHDVALALLDVQMPGMDGFELAELMRGTEKTRRIPIIFLTAGSTDIQRRFRGYEAGAVDFIQKPIEPDILKSKASVFFELQHQQALLRHQRDELRASTEALKIADRRKDEFLATLAHELRNPLAPIRNGLQILQMSPDQEAAEKVRAMMDRQLTHMVRLIDDLLDVSRISRGKIKLNKRDMLLQDAIDAALEASRPSIDAGGHNLTIELPDAPVWVHADITRLAQVINNLLNNAAKYTPPGGEIALRVKMVGERVWISVQDNGLGIPREMLPQIFDMFTQVDNELDRSQGGLGIGLALVKNLLEMHDATIEADSGGTDLGSTFTIQLPVIAAQGAAASPAQPVPPAEEKQALKILVVDDNVPSAQTVGWMLEMIGHTPTIAHDGREALSVAENLKPDVILLDIGLPGMDGYEVCRELRKNPAFRRTMMVAQTGWGQEKDKRDAFNAGFDKHLVKPVSMQDFSDILDEVKRSA